MNRFKSLIWSHFTKTSDTRARCNYCLAVLSFKGGGTTNLIRHVRFRHPTIHLNERTSRINPEAEPLSEGMKRNRSFIWSYFTKTSNIRAECNFCSCAFSFKGGSTANLFRHVRMKHLSINLDEQTSRIDPQMPCENMKRIRSLIWNCFTKTSDVSAKCSFCSSVLSLKGGATTNLFRHVRSKHPSIHFDEPTSIINSEPEPLCKRMNRFRSLIWKYFTKTSDTRAECNFCSVVFSFKGGSTANLFRHVRLKHLSFNLEEQTSIINPEPEPLAPCRRLHKIRSRIWSHFTKTSSKKAKCNVCSAVFSFKGGTTSNLLRHLRLKHLSINLDEQTSIIKPEPEPPVPCGGLNKIRSPIWSHFTKTSSNRAKCNFCSAVFSFRGGSTSNLLRHMRLKHSRINLDEQTSIMNPEPDSPESYEEKNIQMEVEHNAIVTELHDVPSTNRPCTSSVSVPKKRKYEQQHVYDIRSISPISDIRPIPPKQRLKIDFKLVKMLAMDYQSFSIVESQQFQTLLTMLNPSYVLPSRKTVSNHIMQKLYAKVSDIVRTKLEKASAVTVTTDEWTSSVSNESFISVTIHYIDDECKMKSFLLDCFKYSEQYTDQNLADELKRVLREWKVENKVVAVISDNASNITNVVHLCGWKHLPCYAHMLNVIVQTGLKEIELVLKKVRSVVTFFRHSFEASAKLKEMEEQMGFEQVILKQDIPTRWNSTYEMFSRILEVREPLLFTLALLNFDEEQFTQNDWIVINECCKILKFFLEITSDMSAEKQVTASKIIVYSKLLLKHSADLNMENMPIECQNMVRVIKEQIKTKLNNLEDNMLLAESTFLDPRFKKHGFATDNNFDNAKNSIISLCELVTLTEDHPSTTSEIVEQQLSENDEISIWDEYDKKIAIVTEFENVTVSSMEEVNQYIQEPLLRRDKNPLEWWESRKMVYPRLFKIAKKKLCVVATSVPSERIFSKGGQTVTENRARLSANKVPKLEFLNFNLNYLDI